MLSEGVDIKENHDELAKCDTGIFSKTGILFKSFIKKTYAGQVRFWGGGKAAHVHINLKE